MILTFVLLHMEPGSVARSVLGLKATPARVAIFDALYGLNKPLYQQFGIYVQQLFHGNLGYSYQLQEPVSTLIAQRLVTATFAIADSIYALSALSFLGIGPPPPFTDWGTMLSDGVNNLFNGYWWQVYPPLIVLVLVVVAFRQVGDALNDIVSGQRTDAARRRRRFRLLPLSTPRHE